MVTATEKKIIPDGFKFTEIGLIPNDWCIENGEAITTLIGKGASPRWQGFSYTDTGMLFVTSENVRDGFLDLTKPKFLPLAFHEKLQRSKLQKDDILINLVGASIGRSCLIRQDLGAANINQAVAVFRVKEKFNSKFIACYLQSPICIDRILGMQVDAARPNVSLSDLRKFQFPLPPEVEQTGIANALSDVDALIGALEKLINKKSAIKTAAMQQLLTGKKRLPPFDQLNTGYKQTELGEIPGDWEVASLGEIGETIIGLTYSPNDVSDFGTLVLRSSNVQNNRLAFDNNVFVNMVLPDRVIVREADVLVCVRNGSRQLIGKCALIDAKTAGCAFGAFMSIYRSKNSRFVFYQFQSNIIQDQINEVMGATINQITNKDMVSFRISLPRDEKEQTAIANVLSDIDREIEALQQRLHKTQQIKQGMMQELLTGKTRLI